MSQKLDVIDLIIETLKEHEKVLDDLTNRLEEITLFFEKGTQR